ncbi:MAG: hypothetical protein GY865_04900 [candidate division Zixibacteria bacterium]|nr:hypothetical protein [candidate division Zixibacteria bacterium]
MFKQLINFIILAILLLPVLSSGQVTVANPEHATYDVVNNRYLICSFYAGSVVAIDNEGTTSDFVTSIGNAYANHIVGNTLFVTCGQYYVRAYDLTTKSLLWVKYIPGANQLDGLTADNDGHLYLIDAVNGAGEIFKLTISDQTIETFVGSGLPGWPQDVIFDETNNRLLLASIGSSAPIVAVDLTSASITLLVTTPFGDMDGIAMDNDGNVYVTSYYDGTIYKYDQTFTNPPTLISSTHSGPAGLGYNPVDNILAVPNFNANRVDLIPLDDNDSDNILDYIDNCPNTANTDQIDSDEDGDGNACDGCPDIPNPGHEDDDIDGVENACDNCPEHYNPGQEDSNGNDVGDLCDYICGDIDGTPEINILDVVFLINNVYKSGPDPDPLESADVNHDLIINILDIVYLINNIYKSGPDPECVVWI